MYDPTAGQVMTPLGMGKFVNFDGVTGECVIEMGYKRLVSFDASKCHAINPPMQIKKPLC